MSSADPATVKDPGWRPAHRRTTLEFLPASPRCTVRPGPITDVLVWPARGAAAVRQRHAEDDRVLDFALAAHADWKAGLCELLARRAPMDVTAIACEHRSPLGAWLQGAGGSRFAGHPDLEAARTWNRRFHAAAAVVAAEGTAGRWAQATALLSGASFEVASANLIASLEGLRRSAQRP